MVATSKEEYLNYQIHWGCPCHCVLDNLTYKVVLYLMYGVCYLDSLELHNYVDKLSEGDLLQDPFIR